MPNPIHAGDPPTPLPSEVLGSCDAGRGIAAFVLRPTDLDRLPVLTSYPPEDDEHTSCRAVQAGEREEHNDAVQRLRSALQAADAHSRKLSEAAEEQAGALRAEVTRLSGLLDDASAEADRAAAAEQTAAGFRAALDAEQRTTAALRQKLHAYRFDLHDPVELVVTGPGLVVCDGHELHVEYRQHAPLAAVEPLDGEDVCPNPACAKLRHRGPCAEDPTPLDEDPRRPRPGDGWFPEDGITLRYRELRELLALHLDRYGAGDDVVRAMREADVPLRLQEVLDR